MKLYSYWRSSAAYRVRIALNLKGLAYETIPVNILPGKDEQFTDAFRAINPQMRVPTLETEQGALSQSLAIIEWLDETHPEPQLLPRDPYERAAVRAFALAIACDIHPLNNTSVITHIKSQFNADAAAVEAWYVHWIRTGFTALEARLAQRPETAFAFGDAPGLADICLVPQCANARRYESFGFADFPRIAAIDERARALPAFIKAAPQNQKDAPT